MQSMVQTLGMEEAAYPKFITMKTTLYELIEAINEEVEPAEKRLVPEILSDLFDRGLIRLPVVVNKKHKIRGETYKKQRDLQERESGKGLIT